MENLMKLFNAKEAAFKVWANALSLWGACPSKHNETLMKQTGDALCEAQNAYYDALGEVDHDTLMAYLDWRNNLDGMATD